MPHRLVLLQSGSLPSFLADSSVGRHGPLRSLRPEPPARLSSVVPRPEPIGHFMNLFQRFSYLSRPSVFMAAIAFWGLPGAVLGQTQGANELSMDSTLAQHLATAPDPGSWKSSGTFGFQFEDGRVDTRGYSVDAIVAHTTGGGVLLRLEGEWKRAEARPTPEADMFILDDTRYGALSVARHLTGRVGVMTVASWRKDVPVGLQHRAMAQVGPYFALVASPMLKISTIPMVGVGRQENARSLESEGIVHLGGIQSITWHPTRTATVEAYLGAHRVLDDGDDYSVVLNTSVTGALSRNLGLKVYYQLSEEGIHPLGSVPRQHTLGAGINLAFPTLGGG